MALIMDLAMLFAGVNTVLLAGLLYFYGRIFHRSRAVYTAGSVIFAVSLLLQNALTLFAYLTMTALFAETVIPYLLGIAILEFAAVVAVFRITII